MMINKIPVIQNNDGWRNHSIVQNDEIMVEVRPIGNKIYVYPYYAKQGIPCSIEQMFLREGAARRLIDASECLPKGYSLIVYDAWRSYSVQGELFNMWRSHFSGLFPNFSHEELSKYTERYVSLPTRNELAPAPHATGGSVDVVLGNEAGEPLYLGTDFDDMSPKAGLRYLEELLESSIELTTKQHEALINRRILYQAMIDAGFTAYHEEWWHFDYGNQWWGMQKNVPAMYGGIWG